MTKMHELAEMGQAVWIDFIRRTFITSGEFEKLIDQGLRGVTSNPSIFKNAIAGSNDYDDDIQQLVEQAKTTDEIYDALVVHDIQAACDLLRKVYDETGGLDGYVSLEVSPSLADDEEGTVRDARRYWELVDRPNLMIKIPATEACYPAISQTIALGINVNVTLMFSRGQLEEVANAYIAGLEALDAEGGDVSTMASVSSFFVSRVDTKVDAQLETIVGQEELLGKIGVANAKLAYELFKKKFSGDRWQKLADKGARVQRVLWASTSTKNPAYPDTLYVDNLIGPDTVNTIPPETLTAFLDHGVITRSIDSNVDQAKGEFSSLAAMGIDIDRVTDELLEEGVESFAAAFYQLMEGIEEKREKILSGWEQQTVAPGGYVKK